MGHVDIIRLVRRSVVSHAPADRMQTGRKTLGRYKLRAYLLFTTWIIFKTLFHRCFVSLARIRERRKRDKRKRDKKSSDGADEWICKEGPRRSAPSWPPSDGSRPMQLPSTPAKEGNTACRSGGSDRPGQGPAPV